MCTSLVCASKNYQADPSTGNVPAGEEARSVHAGEPGCGKQMRAMVCGQSACGELGRDNCDITGAGACGTEPCSMNLVSVALGVRAVTLHVCTDLGEQ